MYKTVLVKQMIDDGDRLIKGLLSKGIPVRAALWFNDPDMAAWKLFIITPVASQPGPLEAYMQIQPVWSKFALSFGLDDIVVMGPDSTRFKQFQRQIEGASRVSLLDPRGAKRNIAFDDAYIYRW